MIKTKPDELELMRFALTRGIAGCLMNKRRMDFILKKWVQRGHWDERGITAKGRAHFCDMLGQEPMRMEAVARMVSA